VTPFALPREGHNSRPPAIGTEPTASPACPHRPGSGSMLGRCSLDALQQKALGKIAAFDTSAAPLTAASYVLTAVPRHPGSRVSLATLTSPRLGLRNIWGTIQRLLPLYQSASVRWRRASDLRVCSGAGSDRERSSSSPRVQTQYRPPRRTAGKGPPSGISECGPLAASRAVPQPNASHPITRPPTRRRGCPSCAAPFIVIRDVRSAEQL